MDAKYVISKDGQVAVFSKYLGLEHVEVAGMLGAYVADGSVRGAGFCSMVGDQIITFGRSTSTGIAAQPEDASTLTGLLHSDSLTLVFYGAKLGWIATNSPDDFDHEKIAPCTVETIQSARIFK